MVKKILAKNKEGLFDYEILETYQAGIVLTGPEVKSIKLGQISLKGAHVVINHRLEAMLVNCHILAYKPSAPIQKHYDADHSRKLLLHKKEITTLIGKSKQKGLTIIPVSVYTNNGLIKVDIALARGKTKVDKREKIKEREVKRQIQRSLKHG